MAIGGGVHNEEQSVKFWRLAKTLINDGSRVQLYTLLTLTDQ